MHTRLIIFILIAITIFPLFAQENPPKREYRGAWIALVRNEDWPSELGITTEQQQYELRLILDELQANNVNAVIFQIRPECDAIYQSNFEPWSYWLSGEQGQAPEPFYDPLQFAIDEAHKRGMELHAWFNPYRAESHSGTYTTAENHITNTHPDWIVTVNDYKFINPGLQEVREYVVDVILDVVKNYNVDGIHLDDYFYPYPGIQISIEDTTTFKLYPRGFSNIDDWRRDNVHLLVKAISDTLKIVDPTLKYGISPFGIWKNNVPEGIVGLDAYNVIYCDAVTWIENQWLDYLMPQLYWPFGGQQDYGTLLPWWAGQMNGRHLYSGLAFYKSYASAEYGNEVNLNRNNQNVQGSVFFKATNFIQNEPVTDFLKSNQFKYKALLPIMDWKSQDSPNPPLNLRFEKLNGERGDGLVWDIPDTSGLAAEPFMYVAYKLDSLNYSAADLEKAENIAGISGINFMTLQPPPQGETAQYFAVSSLSKNYVESGLSEPIQIDFVPPAKTELEFPENSAEEQPENVAFRWKDAGHSSFSRLEISQDSTFTEIFYQKESIKDTFIVVGGFTGLTNYYWRVISSNYAGEGETSDIWRFKTGFPIPPILSDPPHATTGVSTTPTLTWFAAEAATLYNLQVYLGTTITPSALQTDTLISDTTFFQTTPLQNNRIHAWRVSSSNDLGFGGWSGSFAFKTEITSGIDSDEITPIKYNLDQNYPNPFNPITTIKFSLAQNGLVSIKVYDLLGKEITTIVNKDFLAGVHTVKLDGSQLSSGLYFYRLKSQPKNGDNPFIKMKKMLLLK